MTQSNGEIAGLYGDRFYESQMDGSLRSARKYVEHLHTVHVPRSVVDVGCGRGTWLKAFLERGAERVAGLDGPWNNQTNMLDPAIRFQAMDLDNPPLTEVPERFELAVSLEVAEHLKETSAAGFVGFLTRLSDVVMFGAASPRQGGTNHINEQPAAYWAGLFSAAGFFAYDLFRPALWGNIGIEFWYQQNTFLYVRGGHGLMEQLGRQGYRPIQNLAFMNCVHPVLFEATVAQIGLKPLVMDVASRAVTRPLASFVQGLTRR